MEMTIGEMLFYVEMHTGTVRNINQLTRWFEKYKNCEETVLWVCLDERQVKKLQGLAGGSPSLFTTLDAVRADPWGPVWVDCAGEKYEMGRLEERS